MSSELTKNVIEIDRVREVQIRRKDFDQNTDIGMLMFEKGCG